MKYTTFTIHPAIPNYKELSQPMQDLWQKKFGQKFTVFLAIS
jgi:hypothetical protein